MAEAAQEHPSQDSEVPATHHDSDSAVPSNHQRQTSDPDAQAMLIGSLRSQIQDLFTQVSQLNSKLVKSYDRVSDLEDELHVASSNLRSSSVKISQLEFERSQHLSALNTGLLVEKSHVTTELTRLMEKATEEAAQRGQAETAKMDIEKELDDLSASLFDQANTMVAEARLARAISERKVEEAEQALKGAEEAVSIMQHQMQSLQAEKEESQITMNQMQSMMGKGKWIERPLPNGSNTPLSLRLLSSHVPYQEFLLLVAHLRSIRPLSPHPPAMSTLLPLPFLARLLTEDSEATVRLDLAPSLNWLSRRSVLSAIHSGQLTIEPMSSATILQESSSQSAYPSASLASPISGSTTSHSNVCCALCGSSIFASDPSVSPSRASVHPFSSLSLSRTNTNTHGPNSWSSSLFKNPLGSAHNSPPTTPLPNQTSFALPVLLPPQPSQIFIFRISTSTSTTHIGGVSVPVSLPLPLSSHLSSSSNSPNPNHSSPTPNQTPIRSQSTIYPLCTSSWCLARLRTTCSLWAFVRTGVVEKVWDEEVPTLLPALLPKEKKDGGAPANGKPPVPPRKRGLWGMASALGERAASWNDTESKDRSKEKEKVEVIKEPADKPKRFVAPPLHPSHNKPGPVHAVPPPLPKRSISRPLVNVPPPDDEPTVDDGHANAGGSIDASANHSDGDVTFADPSTIHESNDSDNQPVPKTPDTAADSASMPSDTEGSFSTPTEEQEHHLPSPKPSAFESISVPGSPATIPLPESALNTPTVPAAFAEQQAGASPAIAPKESPIIPSRTSSPAPPPLPRRAAARARPLSTVLPTPAPAPEPVAEPAAPAPKVEEAEVAGSAASTHSEEPATEASEDASTRALSPDATSDRAVSVGGASTELTGDGVSDERAASYDADGEKAQSDDESSLSSSIRLSGKDGDTETVPNAAAREDEDSKNGVDDHTYVGSATWEERTWKELVRLREDMFWARIGGLR